MWRVKVFLWKIMLLLLMAGCQWMGPHVVDPYYQARYRPEPDDWIELRRVELTEEGEIVARGIILGYPQPMVQVTSGFQLTFQLPKEALDFSVTVIDDLPNLSVIVSEGTYAQMSDKLRKRDAASQHQRIGVTMLRNGPYRRRLTLEEVKQGKIPTMAPGTFHRIYLEPGGDGGYMSIGTPPPKKATHSSARAVLLSVGKKFISRKQREDRLEYLFIGRIREGEPERILRLQISGAFLNPKPR